MEIGVVEPQAGGAKNHGGNFNQLDAPRDQRLVVFVRQLAGDGGKQEIGQDEQGGSSLHKECGVPALVYGEIEGDENGDGVAQAVVVEGPDGLGNEEREKPLGAKEGKLVVTAHEFNPRSRLCSFYVLVSFIAER